MKARLAIWVRVESSPVVSPMYIKVFSGAWGLVERRCQVRFWARRRLMISSRRSG